MEKTLSVAAIEKGTVIDHIPLGQALKIVEILKLDQHDDPITIGIHLPSRSQGSKDLIKIENRAFTELEAQEIAIFAPQAVINIIENFEVKTKIPAKLPEHIHGILVCPNERCITRFEHIKAFFSITEIKKVIHLRCKYCEKTFVRDEIKEYQA